MSLEKGTPLSFFSVFISLFLSRTQNVHSLGKKEINSVSKHLYKGTHKPACKSIPAEAETLTLYESSGVDKFACPAHLLEERWYITGTKQTLRPTDMDVP